MSASGNHLVLSGSHLLATTTSTLLPNGTPTFTRARTPVRNGSLAPEPEVVDDDPRSLRFRELFAASESKIDDLFRRLEDKEEADRLRDNDRSIEIAGAEPEAAAPEDSAQKPPPKKSARTIDEDDYGDDSDEDEEPAGDDASPLKAKSTGPTGIPRVASPSKPFPVPPSPALTSIQPSEKSSQGKSAEDVRKSLEEDKKAAEEAVKRDFQLYFYPLDNDKENMLEQQKLEEVERQADMEMNGQGITSAANTTEGSLSQANLGASSLAFKYLIARVDAKRGKVEANDQQLRNLLVEVKKNRSKWASEDKIGQEELYEAAEKVLGEVKAGSDYSQPFLTKVNKREAPDYYLIIKHPMDLSLMTKKLKSLQYKSKKEFVDDLNQIWENCLKYNSEPSHPLRKNAKRFQKEVDRLTPLIPDVVVRDRAEVEAEERKAAAAELGDDNAEDSDDEPIIAARGRKAPGKKAKKGAGGASRKAPPPDSNSTPVPETKPALNMLPGGRAEMLRADSEMGDGSQLGLTTPPAGTLTPAGLNGVAPGSQPDLMDVDGASGTGPVGLAMDADFDDPEYKLWKQVTKRDRAHVTAERNRLFRADRIDVEQPALLRTKAGMRRWVRQQVDSESQSLLGKRKRDDQDESQAAPTATETLAEGMEETEERVLPDYYDPAAAIPNIHKKLKWTEDTEGSVNPTCEEALRMIPTGYFTSLDSNFTKKMSANIRQIQETRKICKKIEVVKQMQLQTQIYQNQFQKYEPAPMDVKDMEPAVISDEGALMNTTICLATMRRSVAQICYTAGFEEFQPSALDTLGELAMDFFVQLATSLKTHLTRDRVKITERVPGTNDFEICYKPFYTPEEAVLLTLYNKSIDVPELYRYATEDVDKLSGRLGILHERMKAHLAELLRPALEDTGEGGVNAFNDGSEQFVGGDFAEELGEDFFGFKELGLDQEFGFNSLSVPLHLLQSRMNVIHASQNLNTAVASVDVLPTPSSFPAVSYSNLAADVGLVHKWFENKLSNTGKNADLTDSSTRTKALTEDEDLPQKQRFPKPRLPPNGKITSPRKKPIREQGPGKGHPKKSMRYVEGHGWLKNADADEVERKMREKEKRKTSVSNGSNGGPNGSAGGATGAQPKTPSKLRIQTGGTSMSRQDSRMTDGAGDDDGDGDGDADADADADGDEDDADDTPAPASSKVQKNKDKPNGFISPVSIEAVG